MWNMRGRSRTQKRVMVWQIHFVMIKEIPNFVFDTVPRNSRSQSVM